MGKESYNGFEALILKNNLVEVAVLPRHQGRIIKYVSKNTGHNHVWNDFSSRYGITNAGLISVVRTGLLSDKWNVLMNDIPLDWNNAECVQENEQSSCQAVIKAKGGGVELEQRSRIFNDSSALQIDACLENKSSETVKVQLNLRGGWAVGGNANASDTLVVSRSEEELMRHRYDGDNYQKSVTSPGKWAAISDYDSKESVLVVGEENLLVYYIFILGHQKTYHLEAFSDVRYLSEGESLKFGLCYYILNMGALDYFDGEVAAGFNTDQDSYLQPQQIKCLVSMGTPFLADINVTGKAEISLLGKEQKIISKKNFCYDISANDLLKGYSAEVTFDTKDLPDGKYTLSLRQSGSGLAREAQVEVNLIGQKVQEINKQIIDLNTNFASILTTPQFQTAQKLPELIGLWMRLKQTNDSLLSGLKKGFCSEQPFSAIDKQIKESLIRADILDKQLISPKNSPFPLIEMTKYCPGAIVYETDYQEGEMSDNLGIYFYGIPVLPSQDILLKIESRQPICPADIPKPVNPDLSTKVEGIKNLLSFDFSNSNIIADEVGNEVAERFSRILGEKAAPNSSKIVIIGNPEIIAVQDIAIQKLLRQIELPPGKCLVKYLKLEERELVLVLGTQKEKLTEAGKLLIDIIKYLKNRILYCGDLHCHTNFSDGKHDPLYSVWGAIRGHSDFLAITDHNEVNGAVNAHYMMKSIGLDYPLIMGQEVQRKGDSNTHVLILGYDKNIDPEKEWNEIIDFAHENQALAILAHPLKNVNSNKPSKWQIEALKNWQEIKLDGFEAIEGDFAKYYEKWNKNDLPVLMGNSDNHNINFSIPARTFVFAKEYTQESIFQAIKDNNCFAYRNGNVFGKPEMLNVFKALVQEEKYLAEMHKQKLAVKTQRVIHALEKITKDINTPQREKSCHYSTL